MILILKKSIMVPGTLLSLNILRKQSRIFRLKIWSVFVSFVAPQTRLAQLEERSTFNRVVVGSIPTSGECLFVYYNITFAYLFSHLISPLHTFFWHKTPLHASLDVREEANYSIWYSVSQVLQSIFHFHQKLVVTL